MLSCDPHSRLRKQSERSGAERDATGSNNPGMQVIDPKGDPQER